MNRANVKILMLGCAVAAIICWVLSCVLYRQPTPEELSFGQQYRTLRDYQQTNEFACQRAETRAYARTVISDAVAARDTAQAQAARRLLAAVLLKDREDMEALRDLLLQKAACAEGRQRQQLRFAHIAEGLCGAILLAASLLFATAPRGRGA